MMSIDRVPYGSASNIVDDVNNMRSAFVKDIYFMAVFLQYRISGAYLPQRLFS